MKFVKKGIIFLVSINISTYTLFSGKIDSTELECLSPLDSTEQQSLPKINTSNFLSYLFSEDVSTEFFKRHLQDKNYEAAANVLKSRIGYISYSNPDQLYASVVWAKKMVEIYKQECFGKIDSASSKYNYFTDIIKTITLCLCMKPLDKLEEAVDYSIQTVIPVMENQDILIYEIFLEELGDSQIDKDILINFRKLSAQKLLNLYPHISFLTAVNTLELIWETKGLEETLKYSDECINNFFEIKDKISDLTSKKIETIKESLREWYQKESEINPESRSIDFDSMSLKSLYSLSIQDKQKIEDLLIVKGNRVMDSVLEDKESLQRFIYNFCSGISVGIAAAKVDLLKRCNLENEATQFNKKFIELLEKHKLDSWIEKYTNVLSDMPRNMDEARICIIKHLVFVPLFEK